MKIAKQMILIHRKIDQILPKMLLGGKDERLVIDTKQSKAKIYIEKRTLISDIIQEEKEVMG